MENNPDIERCERIASDIARKYNLIYYQGDSITTHPGESDEDLKKAHVEVEKYMDVGKIIHNAEIYFFVFDSFSPKY